MQFFLAKQGGEDLAWYRDLPPKSVKKGGDLIEGGIKVISTVCNFLNRSQEPKEKEKEEYVDTEWRACKWNWKLEDDNWSFKCSNEDRHEIYIK